MTRIAFYAPLKAPTHPTPSGDREIARNLMRLLRDAGYDVVLASTLRSFDKSGDSARQEAAFAQAEAEMPGLLRELAEVDLWLTYHNYYKAPDLLGPRLSAALGIPYLQIESTRAMKRLDGPWDRYARAAHAAADQANAIFYFTEYDRYALERDRKGHQELVHLPPFLPLRALPAASDLQGPMLCVGMMREGAKLASYRLVAEALQQVQQDWQLNIVGDGPARSDVEALFGTFGPRVRFLGQLDRGALQEVYTHARLMIWPGVDEAFGMVYLEAQAAGVPVVAQDRPGPRAVLAPGAYPDPEDGPTALAQQIDALLAAPDTLRQRAEDVRAHVATHHLETSAAAILKRTIQSVLEMSP